MGLGATGLGLGRDFGATGRGLAAGCIGCGSGCLAGAVSLAEMIFSSMSRFPLSPVGADPPPINQFIYGKPDLFYFMLKC